MVLIHASASCTRATPRGNATESGFRKDIVGLGNKFNYTLARSNTQRITDLADYFMHVRRKLGRKPNSQYQCIRRACHPLA
jgi:hypothetical protein